MPDNTSTSLQPPLVREYANYSRHRDDNPDSPYQPINVTVQAPHFLVFIYGIEVTEDVLDITITHNYTNSPGTASVILNNNLDKWTLTPRNLGVNISTSDSKITEPAEFLRYGNSDFAYGDPSTRAVDYKQGVKDFYGQDLFKSTDDVNKQLFYEGKIPIKRLVSKDEHGKDTEEPLKTAGRFRLDPFDSKFDISTQDFYHLINSQNKNAFESLMELTNQPELFRYSEYKKLLIFSIKQNVLIAYKNKSEIPVEQPEKKKDPPAQNEKTKDTTPPPSKPNPPPQPKPTPPTNTNKKDIVNSPSATGGGNLPTPAQAPTPKTISTTVGYGAFVPNDSNSSNIGNQKIEDARQFYTDGAISLIESFISANGIDNSAGFMAKNNNIVPVTNSLSNNEFVVDNDYFQNTILNPATKILIPNDIYLTKSTGAFRFINLVSTPGEGDGLDQLNHAYPNFNLTKSKNTINIKIKIAVQLLSNLDFPGSRLYRDFQNGNITNVDPTGKNDNVFSLSDGQFAHDLINDISKPLQQNGSKYYLPLLNPQIKKYQWTLSIVYSTTAIEPSPVPNSSSGSSNTSSSTGTAKPGSISGGGGGGQPTGGGGGDSGPASGVSNTQQIEVKVGTFQLQDPTTKKAILAPQNIIDKIKSVSNSGYQEQINGFMLNPDFVVGQLQGKNFIPGSTFFFFDSNTIPSDPKFLVKNFTNDGNTIFLEQASKTNSGANIGPGKLIATTDPKADINVAFAAYDFGQQFSPGAKLTTSGITPPTQVRIQRNISKPIPPTPGNKSAGFSMKFNIPIALYEGGSISSNSLSDAALNVLNDATSPIKRIQLFTSSDISNGSFSNTFGLWNDNQFLYSLNPEPFSTLVNPTDVNNLPFKFPGPYQIITLAQAKNVSGFADRTNFLNSALAKFIPLLPLHLNITNRYSFFAPDDSKLNPTINLPKIYSGTMNVNNAIDIPVPRALLNGDVYNHYGSTGETTLLSNQGISNGFIPPNSGINPFLITTETTSLHDLAYDFFGSIINNNPDLNLFGNNGAVGTFSNIDDLKNVFNSGNNIFHADDGFGKDVASSLKFVSLSLINSASNGWILYATYQQIWIVQDIQGAIESQKETWDIFATYSLNQAPNPPIPVSPPTGGGSNTTTTTDGKTTTTTITTPDHEIITHKTTSGETTTTTGPNQPPEIKTKSPIPPIEDQIISFYYDLKPGSSIFHTGDPVRIFERSQFPFEGLIDGKTQVTKYVYYHAFTGIVETTQRTHTNDDQKLTITIKDMKWLLQNAKMAIKPAVVPERNLDVNLLGITPFQSNVANLSIRALFDTMISAKQDNFPGSSSVSQVQQLIIKSNEQDIITKANSNFKFDITNNASVLELQNSLRDVYGIILRFYNRALHPSIGTFNLNFIGKVGDPSVPLVTISDIYPTVITQFINIQALNTIANFTQATNSSIPADKLKGIFTLDPSLDSKNPKNKIVLNATNSFQDFSNFIQTTKSDTGLSNQANQTLTIVFLDPQYSNPSDPNHIPLAALARKAQILLKENQQKTAQSSNNSLIREVLTDYNQMVFANDFVRYFDDTDPIHPQLINYPNGTSNSTSTTVNPIPSLTVGSVKTDSNSDSVGVAQIYESAFKKIIGTAVPRFFPYIRSRLGVGNYETRVMTIIGSRSKPLDPKTGEPAQILIQDAAIQFQGAFELSDIHPRYADPTVIRETFQLLPLLSSIPIESFAEFDGRNQATSALAKQFSELLGQTIQNNNFIISSLVEAFFDVLQKGSGIVPPYLTVDTILENSTEKLTSESFIKLVNDKFNKLIVHPTLPAYIQATLIDMMIKNEIDTGYLYIVEPQGFSSAVFHPYNLKLGAFSLFDVDFKDRLAIMHEAADNVGFHLFATPKGDFILQPPMFPFSPMNFSMAYDETGTKRIGAALYNKQYIFDSNRFVSVDYVDQSGNDSAYNVVTVTGEFPFDVAANIKSFTPYRAVIMRNDLIARYGIKLTTLEKEFLNSQKACAAYGYVFLEQVQRNARTLHVSGFCGPDILLCRPVFVTDQYVAGYIQSINIKYTAGGNRTADFELVDLRPITIHRAQLDNQNRATSISDKPLLLDDFQKITYLNYLSYWTNRETFRSIADLIAGTKMEDFTTEEARKTAQDNMQMALRGTMGDITNSNSIQNLDISNQYILKVEDPSAYDTMVKFMNQVGIKLN